MKSITSKNINLFILFAVLFISSCKKEEVKPEVTLVTIPKATDVNKFIYNGLRDYYLWNSQIPELVDKNYQNTDSLNAFLNKYTDPQDLFTSLLYQYKVIDKWSFLVEDAKTLDDWISGTSKTMGYDLDLRKLNGTIFGIVRYVYSGSPAEKAGLNRGDIFSTVNDQEITASNYQKLLFDTEVYKLGFASIVDNYVVPINKTMSMTAIEMQENPINMDTIFTYENQKIGYLVYNGFNSDYDIELNNVMKNFKDGNIEQMVLDLRYNGGGSISSCIYLASMIYSTDENLVFARSKYNAAVERMITEQEGASALVNNFTKKIAATEFSPAATISSLNLKKIYVIVSDNTASASELLINGLRPYMNVVVVGINTYGKYTGSFTIKDWIDDKGNVNPNHKYAMQPITVKIANSEGVSDFVDGLAPTIRAEEDLAHLLPFGDPNETLLRIVLADIKGIPVTGMALKSAQFGLEKIADSHDFKPFAHDMYINPIRKKNQD